MFLPCSVFSKQGLPGPRGNGRKIKRAEIWEAVLMNMPPFMLPCLSHFCPPIFLPHPGYISASHVSALFRVLQARSSGPEGKWQKNKKGRNMGSGSDEYAALYASLPLTFLPFHI